MKGEVKLVVFDLDLHLWPLRVDECVPPFSKNNFGGLAVDSVGRSCSLYPEVRTILNFLETKKYTLAVASRAKNISASYQLLHFLDIAKYFRYKEIYPGTKKQHFWNLKEKSDVHFTQIVFFDNDKRNIKDVKTLGVNCHLVDREISLNFVRLCLNLSS